MSDARVASSGVVAWRTRQLVGIVLAAGLILAVLTLIASRPDPNAVQYTTLFGVAFFLVYVLAHKSIRRIAGPVLLTIPMVLVGPSRLYLGQHWLSDVVGGYAVAAMLLVPHCWAYARWRLDATRRRFAHPESVRKQPLRANEPSLVRPMRKSSHQP